MFQVWNRSNGARLEAKGGWTFGLAHEGRPRVPQAAGVDRSPRTHTQAWDTPATRRAGAVASRLTCVELPCQIPGSWESCLSSPFPYAASSDLCMFRVYGINQ